MARVNPPPRLRIPREFLEKKDTRTFFEQLDFNIFQMWKRLGGGSDSIEQSNRYNPTTTARLFSIEQRLGSGIAFTCDETGFTCDSTRITCDRTET